MSVWIVCPSARPVDQVAKWVAAWRERGYRMAIWRDTGDNIRDAQIDAHVFIGEYPGYAKAVNSIVLAMIDVDPTAEWFIAAGDDVYPDPNHTADEIARQCVAHFYGRGPSGSADGTFGVMQPTGDRYGEQPNAPPGALKGAYIDRVAGSAWIGREFARRVNRGNGPLWPEYFHMFVDQELQEVATNLGVFWQRRELTHHHEHWARARARSSDCPPFLEKANAGYREAEAIFYRRKAMGFPGSDVL